jgi:hypothetical protein
LRRLLLLVVVVVVVVMLQSGPIAKIGAAADVELLMCCPFFA